MEDKNTEYDDQLLQELLQLDKEIKHENRKETIRKKRAEGGKLGGRPRAKNSRKKQVNVGLSEQEYFKLSGLAEAHQITISELFRRSAFGIQMPDAERNKLLIEYRVNFSRISNIFRRDIWDDNEKNEFGRELKEVILLIRKHVSNK